MAKKIKRHADSISFSLRLEPELVAELDEHVERLKKERPFRQFTRTDALRDFLSLGIGLVNKR